MSTENNFDHLLGIKGLSQSQIQTIFETADNFKSLLNSPVKKNTRSSRYYYRQSLF